MAEGIIQSTQGLSETPHAFVALDGLRGIAAVSVVMFHYGILLDDLPLPDAFLAVDFFFVLSGFVIAHAYEKRLRRRYINFSGFMRRRLIRLYPLYFLALNIALLGLAAAFYMDQPHKEPAHVALSYGLSLFLLPTPESLPKDEVFLLNGPAWTLSVEIAINALYALSCRSLTTPRLIIMAVLALAALVATAAFYGNLGLGNDWYSYTGGWTRGLWAFLAGILTYRFYISKKRKDLPGWIGLPLVFALIVIFAGDTLSPLNSLFCSVCVFPVMVFLGARIKMKSSAKRGAQWLGGISYALYIMQAPIGDLMNRLYPWDLVPDRSYSPILVEWVVAALAAAWLATRFYDIPLRKYLNGKFRD